MGDKLSEVIQGLFQNFLDTGESIGDSDLHSEPLNDQIWLFTSDDSSKTALVFSEEELDEWDDIESDGSSVGVTSR
jgi:hypothetical protein